MGAPLPTYSRQRRSDHGGWLAEGPVPDYRDLFVRSDVDGLAGGPWVLVNGFIQQAGSHERETFTFIRGLFMRQRDIARVKEAMSKLDHSRKLAHS